MSRLEGIEQFRKRLEALDKKARNRSITRALREGAKGMARAVKDRARVDTGALRKSIKVRAGRRKKDSISIRVVVTGGHPTPMVAAEEYGTATRPGHPFMRPAFAATHDDVRRLALEEVRRAVEEAGR